MSEIWGFSAQKNTRDWYGSFSSKEEAILEARKWFRDDVKTFYVTRGELIDVTSLIQANDVILLMKKRLSKIGPEDSEMEIEVSGIEVLEAFLEFWSERYASTEEWTQVGNTEKIDVDD